MIKDKLRFNGTCYLSPRVDRPMPCDYNTMSSGYLVSSHPPTYCKTSFTSGGVAIGGGWEDEKVPCGIHCAKIAPCGRKGGRPCNAKTHDTFPTAWRGSNPPQRPQSLPRGEGYFFFPASCVRAGRPAAPAPQTAVPPGTAPIRPGTRTRSASALRTSTAG